MSEHDVRAALLAVPVPEELEAQRRAWRVVSAAHAGREAFPRRPRGVRPLLALAVLAALVAAALSPPGRAVGGWIRDRVAGEENAEPALVRLPAAGRLLVVSDRGPWIVRRDGSKRFLGRYEDASFSPNGLFVVVTGGRRVVAVEPDGDPRWTITRPVPVADARWAPSGFRVAYRAGEALRVVVADGEGDRLLAEGVAAVAPAWQPGTVRNVLAYAGRDGRVRVVDVDTRGLLFSTPRAPGLRKVLWTADGLLVVLTETELRLHGRRGGLRAGVRIHADPGHELLDAAVVTGGDLVYADFEPEARQTTLVRASCFADGPCRTVGPRQIFEGAGHLQDLVVSPDSRWLLAGWPEADQLLFLRSPRVQKIVAVEDVRREFDPGRPARGSFPRLSGWCCS